MNASSYLRFVPVIGLIIGFVKFEVAYRDHAKACRAHAAACLDDDAYEKTWNLYREASRRYDVVLDSLEEGVTALFVTGIVLLIWAQ